MFLSTHGGESYEKYRNAALFDRKSGVTVKRGDIWNVLMNCKLSSPRILMQEPITR